MKKYGGKPFFEAMDSILSRYLKNVDSGRKTKVFNYLLEAMCDTNQKGLNGFSNGKNAFDSHGDV